MKTLCLLFLLSCAANAAELKKILLINEQGEPTSLAAYEGNYLFLSFMFTRCPIGNMCPLTVTLNKKLHSLWLAQGKTPPLRFVFVTLDPARDTPAELKKFAASRKLNLKDFSLLTGTQKDLDAVASEFNVIGVPQGGTISHNMKNILLKPDLTEVKQYKDNEWKPEQVLEDLKKDATSTLSQKAGKPPSGSLPN